MATLDRRRRRRDRAQHRGVKFLVVFGSLVTLCVVAVFAVLVAASTWLEDLPEYDNIQSYTHSGITTIYANDRSTVLAKLYLENRVETTEDQVSEYVLEGTVATEDERFYEHNGVDPYGIMRAVLVNMVGGHEGASTITQQLVRNTVLLDEMSDSTLKRKVREAYIAIKVEETYSKEEILMMYLNVINYGDGCYGIEAASQNYFGKSAADLTLAQAAMLIGIPQSPTANNPRYNYDTALERAHLVLSRMLSNGCITQAEYDKAMKKEPKIAKKDTVGDDVDDNAAYFVDYIKQQLNNSGRFSDAEIAKGGLTVYTTLDPEDQDAAVEAVREATEWEDDDFDVSITTVDPDTGYITAMVGGKDHDKYEFNLSTQMSRQAGSSFKTFTLLAAIEAGVDPYNTYIDSSSPADLDGWEVSNSEGQGYGSMNLSSATTGSVNTVYARTVYTIGAERVVDMAERCGITSPLQAWNSIALGAFGVDTLEMASAYATIAAGGIYREPTGITEIYNAAGERVYRHEITEERVFEESVANVATDILQTVVTSGTGTAASLSSGQPVAGKTGTSENGRDLWFCGFTPQLSTAVWAGYRNERATGLYGGSTCAPIWNDYMEKALEGEEVEQFTETTETPKYTYDWEFPGDSYSDSYSDSDW